MIKINRVLVATDFSEASEPALAYGREFARSFGAALHVLHVVDDPIVWAGAEGAGVDFDRVREELEGRGKASLAKVVTDEDRAQLKAVPVVRAGNTAIEIVRYAKDQAIDLIIMGTHGRGLVGQLMMGSVADKVVRIAPCPVLTVRHPEHEFIVPDALQTVAKSRR